MIGDICFHVLLLFWQKCGVIIIWISSQWQPLFARVFWICLVISASIIFRFRLKWQVKWQVVEFYLSVSVCRMFCLVSYFFSHNCIQILILPWDEMFLNNIYIYILNMKTWYYIFILVIIIFWLDSEYLWLGFRCSLVIEGTSLKK